MASSVRFFVLMSALLLGVHAAFSKFAIPGTYTAGVGPSNCPTLISIGRKAQLEMSSGDVVYTCAGKLESMELFDSSDTVGNELTTYLKENPEIVGTFSIGRLQQDINCTIGSSSFVMKAPFIVNFFAPRMRHNFEFVKIFPKKNASDSHSSTTDGSHPPPHATRFSAEITTQHSNASHGDVPAATAGNETGTTHENPATSVPVTESLTAGLTIGTGEVILEPGFRYMTVGRNCLYTKSGSSACFPASSTVRLASGTMVSMSQLRVGDMVQTGPGKFSEVFMWTHRDDNVVERFVQLTTASGHVLKLTDGHYVYADGNAIPAGMVRVGAEIRLGDGRMSNVVRVTQTVGKGLYNPQTMDGDIVVDGVIASTYTTAVKPEAAHALLAPMRYLYSAFLSLRGGFAKEMGSATGDL